METGRHYYINEVRGSQSPTRRDGSQEPKFLPQITGVTSSIKAHGGMLFIQSPYQYYVEINGFKNS